MESLQILFAYMYILDCIYIQIQYVCNSKTNKCFWKYAEGAGEKDKTRKEWLFFKKDKTNIKLLFVKGNK